MEGTTPTFGAVVTARSNHSVQMSRVYYTLAVIKSLLKIGEGGFRNPWNPPLATPLHSQGYAVTAGLLRMFLRRHQKQYQKLQALEPEGMKGGGGGKGAYTHSTQFVKQ